MNASDIDAVEAKDIAIVGMAGRFPQADDIATFWEQIKNGVELVSFFSDEELHAAGIEPAVLAAPNYVKAKSMLAGADQFDAEFFEYTPREAEITDPQQRVFLECAWHALEDAGIVSETFKGLIGVYASAAWNTYILGNLMMNREVLASQGGFQIFITNDKDFMATRVSYKLNLKGPSLMVQTACSSSLVAVHLACLSLLNFECDAALAGGVSVSVPQTSGYWYQAGGLASPDGHCRPFDAQGQGTVFGNGVGAIVLKRLADALADGDNIYAVIKGSAINNDGAGKVGYTAPSIDGQAEVIAAALALADVHPETIGYVEGHGTGTPLGDPIEVAALTKAYRAMTDRSGFCALGSVKANLGHLDAAAGIAGLIKTVLALRAQTLPPTPHFQSPNPQIDFANTPFYVASQPAPWPAAPGMPRRAGVSSFGIGGTNAHVILEEAPQLPASAPAPDWQLLPLAAKTPAALDALTTQLQAYLAQSPAANLADVAHTLQYGRQHFAQRRCWIVRDLADALDALADPARAIGAAVETPRRSVETPRRGVSTDRMTTLETLARRWLAGDPIDWASVADVPRRRVALPGYPFERQRYWIDPQPLTAPAQAAARRANERRPLDDWFYQPIWAQTPLAAQQPVAAPQRWLVLLDECGLGAGVVARLAAGGHMVCTVRAGAAFAARGPHDYTLGPAQPADYRRLVSALQAHDKLPQTILHLWGVTSHADAWDNPTILSAQQARGFDSLLALAQTLGSGAAMRLVVVTTQLHAIAGEAALCPAKALALGPCRVIPQEYPAITCQSIDIGLPASGGWRTERLIEQLIDETTGPLVDQTIAYRDGQRWVQSFAPVALAADAPPTRLRSRGVYLITGGLGGIGRTLAAYLAQAVQARLVLVGRTALPTRADWDAWLAEHAEDDPTSVKIRAVAALEAQGAQVLLASADVTDPIALAAVVEQTIARFGALHGVVHAAGSVREEAFCAIQELRREVYAAQFQAKVAGLYALEQVLRGHALDFCLLQSSLSSFLGGLGFAAYAAANIFMDAFANAHNRAQPTPWISINWDGWQLGSGAAMSQHGAGMAELAITPAEGAHVFARIFAAAQPQLIVSTSDLQARVHQWIKRDFLAQAARADRVLRPRPQLQNDYVAPGNDRERRIAEIWQDILGVQVGVHDNFFELGGDSLTSVQIIARVKQAFDVGIIVASLYEGPTVSTLAGIIGRAQQQDQPSFETSHSRGEMRRERRIRQTR